MLKGYRETVILFLFSHKISQTMHVVIIIILILAILLVIFTLQNSIEISINVFFWEIANAPLVLVLLCCIFLGYIIAAFYFYPRILKIKKGYKQVIESNNKLKEVHGKNQEKSKVTGFEEEEEETNPEGIELDSDNNENSFFED